VTQTYIAAKHMCRIQRMNPDLKEICIYGTSAQYSPVYSEINLSILCATSTAYVINLWIMLKKPHDSGQVWWSFSDQIEISRIPENGLIMRWSLAFSFSFGRLYPGTNLVWDGLLKNRRKRLYQWLHSLSEVTYILNINRNVIPVSFRHKSRDSSVGIALGYRLDDGGSRVRFPAGAENFSLHHRVQNVSGAHSTFYPMSTMGSLHRGKAAGAWSSPLTSI
jgi:hypothetical protein